MTDSRTLREIVQAHPVPWHPQTARTLVNRQALIQLYDSKGIEVPLFTMLRVVQLVTDKLATQGTPA